MPRASKTTTTSPAPVAPVASAPVVEKAPKESKKASKEQKKAEPVVEVAPVAETKSEEQVEVVATSSTLEHLSSGIEKINVAIAALSGAKQDLKLAVKTNTKEQKVIQKSQSKKKKGTGSGNTKSGFTMPAPITAELADFLGVPSTSELSRTDVSKLIHNYIKTNGLKDAENGRNINADAKLTKLLGLGKEDKLSYFNLQKYIKTHFIKKTA